MPSEFLCDGRYFCGPGAGGLRHGQVLPGLRRLPVRWSYGPACDRRGNAWPVDLTELKGDWALAAAVYSTSVTGRARPRGDALAAGDVARCRLRCPWSVPDRPGSRWRTCRRRLRRSGVGDGVDLPSPLA